MFDERHQEPEEIFRLVWAMRDFLGKYALRNLPSSNTVLMATTTFYANVLLAITDGFSPEDIQKTREYALMLLNAALDYDGTILEQGK